MALVKLNNRGVRSVSTFGSISSLGTYTFIKKLTASSSATLSFVDGSSDVVLDDTYREYLFTFNNIHPSTNGTNFQFNMSADSGSNYNVTKTTSLFNAYHYENDSSGTGLAYITGHDLAQSTSFQPLMSFGDLNNSNDGGLAGYLHIFEPSSTTYVKHFLATTILVGGADGSNQYANNDYIAGYGNTTSAVDAVQFKMSSGNIDAGDICLFGIA